ncbi:MAG: biofilm regulation diguanylate cyclase SiaD [Abitibacteriaceae bacterium]|nr:biofilm regulation diguanylate cyclase SiaD [Abditibacteriaceae bacterium]
MRDDGQLEHDIAQLLDDPQYAGHPLREALGALLQRYDDQLTQLERLTSISDGYQSVLRARNESLTERYRKQIRQLQKIVRISDHYQKMLQETNEALKVASSQDPLTGLPNRRLMMERLKSEAALVARNKSPFSLALLDIDHFKRINDEYGHDIGDAALTSTARALCAGVRAYDFCARWGGEEFMVLLPETSGESAMEISSRVCMSVSTLQHSSLPADKRISVSIGVAEHAPGSEIAETIKQADLALYKAKHAGRNRVMLAT